MNTGHARFATRSCFADASIDQPLLEVCALEANHEEVRRLDQTSLERAAMKAIQIEAFGKPVEVLKTVEIPDVGRQRPAKW